jgi:hypothetical protein
MGPCFQGRPLGRANLLNRGLLLISVEPTKSQGSILGLSSTFLLIASSALSDALEGSY